MEYFFHFKAKISYLNVNELKVEISNEREK